MPNTVDTMEFHKFYIEKWNSVRVLEAVEYLKDKQQK